MWNILEKNCDPEDIILMSLTREQLTSNAYLTSVIIKQYIVGRHYSLYEMVLYMPPWVRRVADNNIMSIALNYLLLGQAPQK